MSLNNKCYSQATSPADTFPIPKSNPYLLFYLQRQPNTNTIVVDLNLVNGKVDIERPVNVYWIRYQEGGKQLPLNFIQKEFGYGMQIRKTGEGKYDLNFVSYKKKRFQLERGVNGVWQVYFTINNGERKILKRVYIQIDEGGSFWKPNIKYVELKGIDPVSNKEVRERIHPKV
ncbi:MAG: DUF4833 domain-containing protein [Ginsengibacter sp.]